MKLSISLIIYELQKRNLNIQYNLIDVEQIVSSIRILDTTYYDDNTLYISPMNNIDKSTISEFPIFVSGIPQSNLQNNIIYVDVNFNSLFNNIQSIFEQYDSIELELIKGLGENKSLKEILNICSKFFDNPIHILDGSMHYIEYSDNLAMKSRRDAVTGKILTETSIDYTDDDIMNLLKEKNLLDELTHSKKPKFIRLTDISLASISINYFEHDSHVAVLSVLETISPLDPSQRIIVKQVAEIIEPLVKKYLHHPELSPEFKQIILDLLQSQKVDIEKLNFYLKSIHWSLNDGYHIFRIKMKESQNKSGTKEYSIGLIKRYFPSNIILKWDDYVYLMIVNTSHQSFDLKGLIEKIQPHFIKEGITISISMYFKNLIKLPEHYKTVKDLMLIGEKLSPEKNILFYNDYTMVHMLYICRHQIDIRVFCLPEAFILYDYDKENGTEFFYSLYIYLKYNRSLVTASNILLIHRNTLVYRIEKAGKLANLNFTNCDIALQMIISYEILYYYDLLSDFSL